jgi:hypothetical protein
MTKEVDQILLRDGRDALQRRRLELEGRNDLMEVFACWLEGPDGLRSPAADAAQRVGGQRAYSDVAILGYGADAGVLVEPGVAALRAGLTWITGRPAFVEGAPTGLGTDGIAAFGIALGALSLKDDLTARVTTWLQTIAAAAQSSGIDSLHRFFFALSSRILGGSPQVVHNGATDLAALRIAISKHGRFEYDGAGDEEKDAVAVLRATRSPGGQQPSPVEAAIRLAALDWISRDAPIALPGRATIPQVGEILRRVPMALRLWTWESKGRTRGSTARQWHIDNEYHVQNLLWTILAPIFPDLKSEESTPSVGQKHPRADLCIPSLRLVVEVKFIRPGTTFSTIVEEVAADAGLYFAAGSPYETMLVFAWDDSARSQEHEVFARGVRELARVADVVVVSRPGTMVVCV